MGKPDLNTLPKQLATVSQSGRANTFPAAMGLVQNQKPNAEKLAKKINSMSEGRSGTKEPIEKPAVEKRESKNTISHADSLLAKNIAKDAGGKPSQRGR